MAKDNEDTRIAAAALGPVAFLVGLSLQTWQLSAVTRAEYPPKDPMNWAMWAGVILLAGGTLGLALAWFWTPAATVRAFANSGQVRRSEAALRIGIGLVNCVAGVAAIAGAAYVLLAWKPPEQIMAFPNIVRSLHVVWGPTWLKVASIGLGGLSVIAGGIRLLLV